MEELYSLHGQCRDVISGTRLELSSKNIRGLNLAVVKLTTIQVTKLPL
jgi:hypothetical protein